jgi:acetyl/propionyl-CoA carboxylase alpha subunit
MFRRIAVVNRGEAAVRFLAAAAELRRERGWPEATIAIHTDVDRRSRYVREADEAVDLGPAILTDPATGQRRSAYLDHARLETALRAARPDAVWVGWGFVAEDPAFAELCERLGVVFIGPTAGSMRLLGDKLAAKLLAEDNDVPVVPWSGGALADVADAAAHAERIGYPVVLKASAGGGGRGIRIVEQPEDLAEAFDAATREAVSAFGDGRLFLEAKVVGARHIEVQVAADATGEVMAFGVRDCSVQRRNQKVIEESPRPRSTRPSNGRSSSRRCACAGRPATGTSGPSRCSTSPNEGGSRSWRSTLDSRSSTP